MSNPVDQSLAKALEQLTDGEREPALASLLEAWREQRSAEIADVIDLPSAELTKGEPPILAAKNITTTQSWFAAAQAARPAALERLPGETMPVDCWASSRALLALPPDPRVATWVGRWFENRSVPSPLRGLFFAS